MARFRDLPIRGKLMTGFMLTSVIALLVTIGVLAAWDRASVRDETLADANALAGIIAENASSSIVFNDRDTAGSTLSALRSQPDILAGYLFDAEGKLFASYAKPGAAPAPATIPTDGPHWEAGAASVVRPVSFNGKRVGTLYVRSSLRALEERRSRYIYVAGLVVGGALLVALLLSAAFQRAISRPLLNLLRVAKQVSRDKNYQLRASKQADDEVGKLIDGFNEMLGEIQSRDAEIQERHRQEMALARTIQTSVLPRSLDLPGFDISAIMLPAEEVGGDFYEFRPNGDGAWIGVGDVTGHGVTSGLIMMMAQSMFTMLCEQANGTTPPSRFVSLMNRAMYYNLRSRLGQDRFMTMVIAKISPQGDMVYAGAHTDLLIYRAANGHVDRLPTEGLWLGMADDIEGMTTDRALRLGRGDIALFHTDGVTEARNATGECYDMDRLSHKLIELHNRPASDIVNEIAHTAWNWAGTPMDDVSLLAIKRTE